MIKRILPVLFCVAFLAGAATEARAQLVNFEETWKAFLENNKTSNISTLPQPEVKSIDFPKYCLMYANSNFCFNRVDNAEKFMGKIAEFGEENYKVIPGFVERYKDLGEKIKAYYALDKVWQQFLETHQIAMATLEEVATARTVCEKGTLAKYTQMETYALYCAGDVEKAKDVFENYVLQIVDKTTLKLSDVNGLEGEVKVFRQLFKVLPVLNKAWAEYIKTGESKGFEMEVPVLECNAVPAIKSYVLIAAADICNQGVAMLEKIEKLEAKNKANIDEELADKIDWLRKTAKEYNGDPEVLTKTWKVFVPKNTLGKQLDWTLEYCDKLTQVRSYVMNGILNCDQSEAMLAKIEKLKKEHTIEIDKETAGKIELLEKNIKIFNGDLSALTIAWDELVAKGAVGEEPDYSLVYCDKVAQIRSFTINGVLHHCTEGEKMLAKIAEVQKAHSVKLDSETDGKVGELKALVQKEKDDVAALNGTWKTLVAQKDTLTEAPKLAEVYCDKIAQVRYWTLQGHLHYTDAQGDEYMAKIDGLLKDNPLKLDTELSCSIERLRHKIWTHKYWQLVLQARKETHEERERFGPEAAKLMYGDLNGPNLPCETTVEYSALGNIGVKYVITTFLCQNINLAKMGDPEYYKKIATWVDGKVLQKYCAVDANMRCKKDFFIYLEGHSDGNRFSGATYKESLEIPQGTPFTHFIGDQILNKTTDRAITNSLKNNMELGIARAWTVKKQLDFMGVPISIGAFEHPESEKGGEFRRIEIELNIPNLLLDFYELRLKTLWEESGIGEQPKTCL